MFDSAIRQYTLDKIRNTEIVLEPFPHFYVQGLIPDAVYADLLANLPEDSIYDTYKPPYEARLFLNLEKEKVGEFPEKIRRFWVDFEQWINSQEFLDAMVERFGDLLRTNGSFRRGQMQEAAGRGDSVTVTPRTLLARDYAHFALGPHTDSANKFITALYYLPVDERFREFGTSVYRPKTAGYTSWDSKHHKHEDFDLVRTFANLPNTLFAFMKSDKSFHGVEQGDYPNVGRNLVMWFPEIGAKQGKQPLSLARSTFEDGEPQPVRKSLFQKVLGR